MTPRVRGRLTDIKEQLADLLTHTPIDRLTDAELVHMGSALGNVTRALACSSDSNLKATMSQDRLGTCPVCKGSVPLTVTGYLRTHGAALGVCRGSGARPGGDSDE